MGRVVRPALASNNVAVGSSSEKLKQSAADQAVLAFLVESGISPSVVDMGSFQETIKAIGLVGDKYRTPRRQSFGLDRVTTGGLGSVLQKGLKSARQLKDTMLKGCDAVGGTLCHDGAKWSKRSLVNSVLITSSGVFHAQSTDATGVVKTTAWLKKDIVTAIQSIGQENCFIVCLDGACKSVLQSIVVDPAMHQISPQRCSTHGAHFLMADIAQIFREEIRLCVRLLKLLICTHDVLYKGFEQIEGSKQLFAVAEARSAAPHVYSSERILDDKKYLVEFFTCKTTPRDYFATAHPDAELCAEYNVLKEEFILNAAAWCRLTAFVEVESPIRALLRVCVGDTPNLALVAYQFEDSKKLCLEAAVQRSEAWRSV